MRENPSLKDECIIVQLRQAYGLKIAEVEFLPLEADHNSATYRIVTDHSVPCFLKLSKGNFDETSLVVPQFLHEQGVRTIIPPRKTEDGQLWSHLDAFTFILYPFIAGRNGFEAALYNDPWINFWGST